MCITLPLPQYCTLWSVVQSQVFLAPAFSNPKIEMDRGSKPPVLKCRRALSASLVLNKSKDLLMPPHGRGGSSPLPGTISFQSIYADAANAVLSVFVWPVLVVVPVAVSASR